MLSLVCDNFVFLGNQNQNQMAEQMAQQMAQNPELLRQTLENPFFRVSVHLFAEKIGLHLDHLF